MDELQEYINKLRFDFSKETLEEDTIEKNPIKQFEKWFKQAVEAKIPEPNAMVVATVSDDEFPSARVVLMRNFNDNGFVFYTNYNSRKGKDIEKNPKIVVNFYWSQLERQVKIKGIAEKLNKEESDSYFSSRPRESQIGAWASSQSEVIKDRKALEDIFIEISNKYKNIDVPRPPHWGGYIIKPISIEFWQGRQGRLHDRIRYRIEKGNYIIERLAP